MARIWTGLLATAAMMMPVMAAAQAATGDDAARARVRARMDARGSGGGGDHGARPGGGWQRGDQPARPDGGGGPRGEQGARPQGGWQRGEQAGRPNGSWPGAGPRPAEPQRPSFSGDRPDRPRPGGQFGNAGRDALRPDWRPRDQEEQRRWQEARRAQGGDRADRGDVRRERNGFYGRRQWANRGWDDRGYNGRGYDDRGGWSGGGGWSRDWRRDTRYDWNRYRGVNRNAYRLPRYGAPYGWNGGYRRFSIGVLLSAPLFAQDYWIDDPWTYRLPDAYGPYRWVRYYNDALLVDVENGEVVDTIYDIFW